MGQIGDLEFVDDRVLSVVGTSGQLLLIDVNAGHEMRHLATHSLMHGVLDVSPDGRILGVGSGDGSIKLLDVSALLKPTVFWHDADVRHVPFVQNGSRLLAAERSRVGASTMERRRWSVEADRRRCGHAISSLRDSTCWIVDRGCRQRRFGFDH